MHSFSRAILTTLLTVALCVRAEAQTATVTAQAPRDSAKTALIRQLIADTHAVDLGVTAMQTSLPAQRASHPEIPGIFWDRLLSLVQARRDSLANMYVDIYDRHFSSQDLQQLLAFYHTPAGQKLLAETPAMTRESITAAQAWGVQLGMEVARQLAAEGVQMPRSF